MIIINEIDILGKLISNDNYKISFHKLVNDKLYVGYICYSEQYNDINRGFEKNSNYCIFIIIDMKSYSIKHRKIFNGCYYCQLIDEELFLVTENGIRKYDKEYNINIVNNIKYLLNKDYYIFKHDEKIFLTNYFVGKYYITNIYNNNNKVNNYSFIVDVDKDYGCLLSFYSTNYLFVLKNKVENNDHPHYVVYYKNSKVYRGTQNFPKNFQSINKIAEHLCLIVSEGKQYLYNFITFKRTEFKYYVDDITKFHYIDNNHYIYNNKLCIVSRNKIATQFLGNINNIENIYDSYIILKSSISNKHEYISKQLLISRCDFFKNIFEIYDKEINAEFKNEYFENIDIYNKYIDMMK